MISEKSPAEKLDDNNNKRLQKIVGNFLYYARAVDPTMLTELNSLSAVHIKPKIKTTKQETQSLNHSATHPDKVTEYRTSGMILHIYLYASYFSEPEA